MTEADGLDSVSAERMRRQLETWRKDLLALDRRQRLLYFKHTASASLELVDPDLGEILQRLTRGAVGISASDDDGYTSTALAVGNKSRTELAPSLRRLDQTSNQIYADRGFWPLYVALGMIEWIDAQDGALVSSPLLLVPVRLDRGGSQSPYRVSRTEDDPVLNPALRLKLERDFGVVLPDLPEEVDDVWPILDAVETAIAGREGWRVAQRSVMTTFSFLKEAIFRDLQDNEELVLAQPLVQLIALGPESAAAGHFEFEPVPDEDLDTAIPPEQLSSIRDADSSQRKCILAARDGRSFVMDGPPGTGKSQTIANIIAELMTAGRSVLFVSEKAAALDVVRNRLEEAGLREFVLELHSHTATRKQFAQVLGTSLTTRAQSVGGFSAQDEKSLTQARWGLTDYASALNETRRGLGRSVHEVLGRLADLHLYTVYSVTLEPQWGDLTAERLSELLSRAEALARAWRPVSEGTDYLWRDLATVSLQPSDVRALAEYAGSASVSAHALVDLCRAMDTELPLGFGMGLTDAEHRADVLREKAAWPDAPDGWLSAESLQPIRELAARLTGQWQEREQASRALETAIGPRWPELDGDRRTALTLVDRPEAEWLRTVDPGADDLRATIRFLQSTPSIMVAVGEDARRLAAVFGIPSERLSLKRARDLVDLAALADRPDLPEPQWFNPGVQRALDEARSVLGSLVGAVRASAESLSSVFTPDALQLDLEGLRVRFEQTHRGLRRFSSQARADRRALKAVTVARKVNKALIERLPEAIAWQEAERLLGSGEQQHAATLGGYYRKVETDFARLGAAIEAAHTALRLAGEDLDPAALSRQLSTARAADPTVTSIGHRLGTAVQRWTAEADQRLGPAAQMLTAFTLRETGEWCAEWAAPVQPVADVARHVADVAGRDLPLSQVRTALEQSATFATLQADLFNSYDQDAAALGSGYRGGETDWQGLDHDLGWAERLRVLLGGPLPPATAAALRWSSLDEADLRVRIQDWVTERSVLLQAFTPERAGELTADLDDDLREAAAMCTAMRTGAQADIDEWIRFVTEREALEKLGLSEPVTRLAQSRAPSEDVRPALEHAVLEAWVGVVLQSDTRLRAFRAVDRDALVEQFRQLDQKLVESAHSRVVRACNGRRPNSLNSPAARVLKHESEKKTRHKPIRQLLETTHDLVLSLKPCFMMSPLSVSQYLPPTISFDVVIFDEASQVMPSDAVNSIYRGRQLIVAGDQKQLPPTSFFASAAGGDGEGGNADDDSVPDVFDSVLDLCKAAAMPALPLTWHYRSQHEDLITYSNYAFYGGQLHTFPGATYRAADLGVESFVVNGVYRRGTTRDNPIEAEAVIDRLLHHRREHPDQSIGVVTFSTAQEDAIWAALDRRSSTAPELAELASSHDRLDGFFVKPLENVQGDERDIIVFSIGYGPDEHGKFTLNLGPLIREGGWRRLNVAITRARRRVEIVSSFRPDQIPSSSNVAINHLRGYLDFAQRGVAALASATDSVTGDVESPFEADVLSAIRGLGYQARPQVGAAGYRIDLAVEHPRRPGAYLLAVECDGATYHSAKAARDRDRLRQVVLEGLGWQVHRIWSVSWVRDREGQIARLKAAIESAMEQPRPLPTATTPPVTTVSLEEADFDARPSWVVDYEITPQASRPTLREPQDPGARAALAQFFARVIAVEGPVHEDVLFERFRRDWGVGRVGHLIRDNLLAALRTTRIDGALVQRDSMGFYRVTGKPVSVVRAPADQATRRSVQLVPRDEIELAVLKSIHDAKSMDQDSLTRGVALIFGWGRTGAEIQAVVDAVVSSLLQSRRLRRSDDGLMRPNATAH